jgi:hypothetical protein
MVPAEATDVAGVSIGNRRSALDAKGGCRSMRTTPATLHRFGPSARQLDRSGVGGGVANHETLVDPPQHLPNPVTTCGFNLVVDNLQR